MSSKNTGETKENKKQKKDNLTSDMVLRAQYLKNINRPLLEWYHINQRQLPWRQNVTAYRTYVSEIMLQQTRVEAVMEYFKRFMNTFPTIQSLAETDTDKLMKMWEGLGYYSRARNLQKSAQIIMKEYDGIVPSDFNTLCTLPGIGRYTAGAIASIAYNRDEPAVDGNFVRVISRVLAYEVVAGEPRDRDTIEQLLRISMPKGEAACFNQAIMDIGATICIPNGTPQCTRCPLREQCKAFLDGSTDHFPIKKPKKERRQEAKTVLIIMDKGHVALEKRGSKGLLAGLYAFPMMDGYVDTKEMLDFLCSNGVQSIRIEDLGEAKHIFSHVEWHMRGYLLLVDELSPMKNETYIFADKHEIGSVLAIPSAYRYYLNKIQRMLVEQER